MTPLRWVPLLALPLWLPALPAPAQAQSTGPSDADAGARIYRSHCTECHGLNGEGGRGPSLNRGEFRVGSSDEVLLRTVMMGIPGTEMPGIYLQEHQIRHVVAFLRRLNEQPAAAPAKGDTAKGRTAYERIGCGSCHMIDGQGGRLGPDLSDAGGRRTAAHLRDSIVNPDADVPSRYWRVRYPGPDGRIEMGLRLNEDSYEIRMLDANQQMRTLSKTAPPAPVVERKSLMPAYRQLAVDQLDDLVAYLTGLRSARRNP